MWSKSIRISIPRLPFKFIPIIQFVHIINYYCVCSTTMKLYRLCVIGVAMVIWRSVESERADKFSETEASKYLVNANRELAQWTNRVVHSDWNWLTNLTDENAEKKVRILYCVFVKVFSKRALKISTTLHVFNCI